MTLQTPLDMQPLLNGFAQHIAAMRSPQTASAYCSVARSFVAFAGHETPTRWLIDRFLVTARPPQNRASTPTRNHRLAALRALGNYALAMGAWTSNPAAEIVFLREPPKDPAVLSSGEVQRLFEALDVASPARLLRNHAMLSLLFTTGLRVHELVGLDVRQVDALSSTLLAVRGKGGTVHDLPLEPRTLSVVRTWIETRPAHAKVGESALFVSRFGTRLSTRTIQRLFTQLGRSIGSAKKITPHTARHSVATLALMRGADISTIGDLLRHSNLNTTRRYLRLVDTRKRQVVELLSDLVPGGPHGAAQGEAAGTGPAKPARSPVAPGHVPSRNAAFKKLIDVQRPFRDVG